MKTKRWMKYLLMTMMLMLSVPVGVSQTTAPVVAAKTDSVKVGTKFWKGSCRYKVTSLKGKKGTAALVDAKTSVRSVSIPKTVKKGKYTLTVTSIGKNAFKDCRKLETVITNKEIKKIGKNAFKNCKKLKTLSIRSTKLKGKGVDKSALKGISGDVVVTVPEGKAASYQKMFGKTVTVSEDEQETEASESAQTDAPETTQTEVSEPAQTDAPETTQTEVSEPAQTEALEPAQTDVPETVQTDAPKTEQTEAPKTEQTEAPKMEQTEAPKTEQTETPKRTQTGATVKKVSKAVQTEAAKATQPAQTDATEKMTPKTEQTKTSESMQTEARTEEQTKQTDAPETAQTSEAETVPPVSKDETVPPVQTEQHSHSFEVWETVVPATCLAEGQELSHCECGETEIRSIPKTTEHQFGEWEKREIEDCWTEDVRTCEICQTEETKNRRREHRWKVKEVTAPTCTEPGRKTTVCECGANTFTFVSGKALGHEFTVETEEPATCVQDGARYNKCVRCEEKKVIEVIPKTGHSWSEEEKRIEPTCTQEGKIVTTCTVCGEENLVATIPALGHDFQYESDGNATCTKNGTETGQCSRCKETDTRTEKNSALGHVRVTVPAEPADCTEETLGSYDKCSRCGYHFTEPKKVPGSNHVFDPETEFRYYKSTKYNKSKYSEIPACTSGNVYNRCKRCGKELIVDWIPGTGHSWKEVNGHLKCEVCGRGYESIEGRVAWTITYTADLDRCVGFNGKDSYTVISLSTSQKFTVTAPDAREGYRFVGWRDMSRPEETPSGEATRTDDWTSMDSGFEAVYEPVGGQNEVLETPVQKAPRKRQAAKTAESSQVQSEAVTLETEPHTHSFGNWAVTTEATCTTAGEETAFCSCGAKQTRSIAAKGHSFGSETLKLPVNNPDAKCYFEYVSVCETCGFQKPTGRFVQEHTLSEKETVPPTCTDYGKKYSECTVCGQVFFKIEGRPLGHSYQEDYTEIAPDCTTVGLRYKECLLCGERTEVTELPATGHDWQTFEEPASCTTMGRTIERCAFCGKEKVVAGSIRPALGHEFVEYTYNEDATCTLDGTETAVCSRCEETRTRTKPGTALGHDLETHPAIAASCTSDGLSEYVTCRRCIYRTNPQKTSGKAHNWSGEYWYDGTQENAKGLDLESYRNYQLPAGNHCRTITIYRRCLNEDCNAEEYVRMLSGTGHTWNEEGICAVCHQTAPQWSGKKAASGEYGTFPDNLDSSAPPRAVWAVFYTADMSKCEGFTDINGNKVGVISFARISVDDDVLSDITAPAAKPGYRFVGWRKEGTEELDPNPTRHDGWKQMDMTFEAVYESEDQTADTLATEDPAAASSVGNPAAEDSETGAQTEVDLVKMGEYGEIEVHPEEISIMPEGDVMAGDITENPAPSASDGDEEIIDHPEVIEEPHEE